MKKIKFFRLFVGLFLFVMGVAMQSCSEEKYTIWTDHGTYSEFQSAFSTTLDDGYYIRVELDNEQWALISKNLTTEGRHKWDEATIKKWFISNGFGETEATKESSWLALTNHGFIATRSGNIVYVILK